MRQGMVRFGIYPMRHLPVRWPGLAPHASFNTNGNASSTTPTPDPSAAAATSGGRARNAARGVGRGGRGGQSLEAPLLDESGGAENV